jgi:hypothetical protein
MNRTVAGSDALPVSVYQYDDLNGVPLYIGISNAPALRDFQHSQTAVWYNLPREPMRVIATLPTRELALAVEAALIRALTPVFNVAEALPYAKSWRQVYLAGIHTITTVSSAIRPRLWRITCGLCPRWEAWAGNDKERDRWISAHLGNL